jgi:hypothetical protein
MNSKSFWLEFLGDSKEVKEKVESKKGLWLEFLGDSKEMKETVI